MVLIVEITCFSQDVQLLSACSDKFLTVQQDRIFANQNSESPQNFTIQSHQYTKQNMAPDIRITFYVKERGAYICFNQKWQPRLMKKKNLKDEHSCHFREAMDHGYSTFSSVKDPQKYLGFMRNGRPINYERIKNDEKCRRIFKRIIENSSNDVISNSAIVAYQETSTLGNRKSSSSRIQQKTHSNKIDMSKPRNTSRAKGAHPVRHHHNESPLRHPHHQHQQNNINSNNNSRFNASFSSRNTKQLDNENFNTIYNNPSNNVNSNNNISDNNEKVTTHHIRHQHHRKIHQNQHQQQQQSFSDISSINDPEDQQGFVSNYDENNHYNENSNKNNNRDNWNKDEIDTTDNHSNNNSNNSTSNCSSDDFDNDKHLKGKKNVRGRNVHANEKQQNNKCNNRKSKKNNENVRHSRKSNQKNSHKINRTPEN